MSSSHDTVQSFLFQNNTIRGHLVHLNRTFQTITQQRPYPIALQRILGEAMAAAVLMGNTIKYEGFLSLQCQGNQALPWLLIQYDHLHHLRATARYQPDANESDYQHALDYGQMLITIQHQHHQPYQSTISMTPKRFQDQLMDYFAQSEQLTTHIILNCDQHQAAGMMLQLMPHASIEEREQFWSYATTLSHTITKDELFNLENQTLLHRLYHETELILFESKEVSFQCRCHADKIRDVILTLGQDEAEALLKERGVIDIQCDFCNKNYQYDPIDIAYMFKKN